MELRARCKMGIIGVMTRNNSILVLNKLFYIYKKLIPDLEIDYCYGRTFRALRFH